ncbi:MAG: hypothetical protein ACOX78_08605 [Lachnospiraceae bacterium]|jgi:hypothetical protein
MKILRRILAACGVAAWAVLLILTLVAAFSTGPFHDYLLGLLVTDIALPVVLYAMQLMYRVLKRK